MYTITEDGRNICHENESESVLRLRRHSEASSPMIGLVHLSLSLFSRLGIYHRQMCTRSSRARNKA